jgi:hypothetical protein
MKWTAADEAAGSLGTQIQTSQTANQYNAAAFTWPNGHYVDAVFRVTAQSWTALNWNTYDALTWFGFQGNGGTTWMEWDAYDFNTGGCIQWYNSGTRDFVCGGGYNWTNFSSGWTPVPYHTYGHRSTSDGTANMAKCVYMDGVLGHCYGPFPPDNTTIYTQRDFYQLALGSGTAGVAPSADMDLLVQRLTFFDCPNWQTQQCNGTVLTTAP